MRIFWLFVLLVFSGCGGSVSSNSANNGVNSTAGNQATANYVGASPTASTLSQTVTIDSPDGLKIVGSYFESSKPNSPGVLLLHQWQSDRHSYDGFAKQLNENGFNVLSIDGRGFGESVRTADGKTIAPERTDAAVKAMFGDVGAAFDFLSKQKNVDPGQVGIVGASYGSSLAIIYAANHPNVAAVALLSPGLNYFGNMPTEPAVKSYGNRPLYLLAGGEKDKESADAVNQLNLVEGGKAKYRQTIHPDGEHGTGLLKVGGTEELEDFFLTSFGKK